jgi:hypothetical protein
MVWTGVILVGTLLVGAFIALAIYRWQKRNERRHTDAISECLKRRLEELKADRIVTEADEWQAEEES